MPQKIAIANQKGGVGKTTTATNLASVAGMGGRKTLLVDFDPQGNATTGLGLSKDPARGTNAVLQGGKGDPVTPSRVPGLDVMTSCTELVAAETLLARKDGRREFRERLDRAVEGYEVVIVDCPPSMGGITRAVLAWVDNVLVPVQCEFYAMEGLAQILGVIQGVREGENPALGEPRFLLTMFDPSLPFHQEVVANLREHLEDKILRTIIPRDIALAEAASHGVPVVDYDWLSRGAYGYLELGKEFAGHGGQATR